MECEAARRSPTHRLSAYSYPSGFFAVHRATRFSQACGLEEMGIKKLGFWATAQDEPSRAVIVGDDGVRHSAGDVLSRVNRQTHALRSLGLQPGDAVAACVATRVELLELYLAALQSGW